MTCQNNELVLNNTLIQMACSFLQYVAESWPWVNVDSGFIEAQVRVLAARQRQDVGEIVTLLTEREHYIDFGSFPTEYTDQQFLSLQVLISRLKLSQTLICNRISTAGVSLKAGGDVVAAELLASVEIHEREILNALFEVEQELLAAKAVI